MLNKAQVLIKKYSLYVFLFLALFARYINIYNIASWSHDNSRDVVLIYKLFTYHEIIWRGPVFSVIWGFLSPLYYYILAPFYWAFSYQPLVPGSLSLFVNFLTLLLLFYVVNKVYNFKTSLIASLIYAFSFVIIKEGAYGLNPNFVPPFTILFFYSLYKTQLIKDSRYLVLLAFCSSMLISFHPGGVFLLPSLPVLYLIFKPKFKVKEVLLSIFVFFAFGIAPYALIEKKFDLWNIRQLVKYVKFGSAEAPKNIGHIQSFLNFLFIYLKNISLVIFSSVSSVALFSTFLIIIFLIYQIYKNKDRVQKIDKALFIMILVYMLLFGVLITFDASQGLTWWFHTSLIPLTLILFARVFSLLNNKILLTSFIVFICCNLYASVTYIPPLDTYLVSKMSVKKVVDDSNGQDFDIYGSDERPINYMVWYFEKDPTLKAKYYTWIKWDKNKNSKLVYYLESYDSSLKFETSKGGIKEKHQLYNESYVGSVGKSVKIYKLY